MQAKAINVLMALTIVFFALSASAQQQGTIELQTTAEKLVKVEKEDGEVEVRQVPAQKVIPGEEVIYTIRASNVGQENAEAVTITDPIPEHMKYTEGSAGGEGATITFSVDGGKTYAGPASLTVTDDSGEERPAKPSDYTHIRWVFDGVIEPGSSRFVQFRARLQ